VAIGGERVQSDTPSAKTLSILLILLNIIFHDRAYAQIRRTNRWDDRDSIGLVAFALPVARKAAAAITAGIRSEIHHPLDELPP
jgi:hypothetical protein